MQVHRPPPAPAWGSDGAEILMPGERAHRTYEQRTREGIPISHPVHDALARVAGRLGVPMLG
ncbi:MAG TPA: hypothetical protein VLF19_03770 [Methylomirabilota bacterium]|nr:hypothetical protein [Methylomirabilota bacterium]